MSINLHHLELFYHVARHQGQSAASRKIGYGIQPSTISRQICLLERQAGVSLYVRDPFKLTAAGEKLFKFIKPLFDELPRVVQGLSQGMAESVHLGASAIVVRDYLPAILPDVQRRFPQLILTVSEGLQSQIDLWLKEERIDLAVTLLQGTPPRGYQSQALLSLPLVLLVPRNSSHRSAGELWRRQPITPTLICPGPEDVITKYFCQGLDRRGIAWPVGMVVNSIGIVESFVKRGFGIGVSVALPGRGVLPGLRALPLPDFPRVSVGIIWKNSAGPGDAFSGPRFPRGGAET